MAAALGLVGTSIMSLIESWQDWRVQQEFEEQERLISGLPKRHLASNRALLVAALIILPPVGIWLIWKHSVWSRPIRITATVISSIVGLLIALFILGAVVGNSDTNSAKSATEPDVSAFQVVDDKVNFKPSWLSVSSSRSKSGRGGRASRLLPPRVPRDDDAAVAGAGRCGSGSYRRRRHTTIGWPVRV